MDVDVEKVTALSREEGDLPAEHLNVTCTFMMLDEDFEIGGSARAADNIEFGMCTDVGDQVYYLQLDDMTLNLDSGLEYALSIVSVRYPPHDLEPEDTLYEQQHAPFYRVVSQAGAAASSVVSVAPSKAPHAALLLSLDGRCTFTDEKQATYIGGCSAGCQGFGSLEQAQAACSAEPTCGGVTGNSGGSWFTLRSGPHLGASPSGESSWVCQDFSLYCSGFPTMEGTEQERCEGGNRLNRGVEYIYNAGLGTATAACGSGSTCKCCKRVASGGTDTSQPKVMTILQILCNYTDQHPGYGGEAGVMDALYGDGGMGTFTDMIAKSSYGLLIAPRWAGAAITVQMGTSWGNVTNCPAGGIANLARSRVREQYPDLDMDAYDYYEFFIPTSPSGGCSWAGLAGVGCGHYSQLPKLKGSCTAWYRAKTGVVRAHELGHNLGLSHAGSTSAEYGDPQALMGTSYSFSSFTAAARYQMGFLQKAPGQVFEWAPQQTNATALQSLSLPLGQPGVDYVAMMIRCPECVPKVPGHQGKVGGYLWVSFRGDEGYSSHDLKKAHQNKVYVHLARAFTNPIYGSGTEMWAKMVAGQSYRPSELNLTIYVCEIFQDWAKVSVAEDEASAKSQCPVPQPTTTTTTTTHLMTRCEFSEEMANTYIGGCSLGCKAFDGVHEAQGACDMEASCGGVTKAGEGYQLRRGPHTGASPAGEISWVCSPKPPVTTEPVTSTPPAITTTEPELNLERCDFSEEMASVYIGGCSLGCKSFTSLHAAQFACDREGSCGGVTKAGNGYQLRRGPHIGHSPSGESSWVCLSDL